MTHRSLVLVALLAGQAIAEPEITFRAIATPATTIHPLGNRPSLHNGLVAFYGYRGTTYGQDVVVATAPSDGAGPFVVLAQEGDPRPDRPGKFFGAFGNPGLYNGRVVFFGEEPPPGGFPSTYVSDNGGPYELFDDAGIVDPFVGPSGVSSKANPWGVSFRSNSGVVRFLGLFNDPFPCATGTFAEQQTQGLRFAPQSDHHLIFPTRVSTQDFPGDSAVVAYDITTDTLSCVATGADTIPQFGGPFDFFLKADTDGIRAAFIGYDPTLGFDRHEGVYIRDLSGTGPIVMVADKLTPAPSGGSFGTFANVSIDGDLVLFEGCSGGQFGCARYGIYGCFLDNGVPGPIFDVVTTDDTLDKRGIIDLTINPRGHDGNQLAFDVRHSANSASLYVASITPPPGPPCAPDLTGSTDPNDPGFGVPDGILDANDFFFYLGLFGAGDLAADLTGSIDPNDPGFGVPDGSLDANDYFFYLDLFAQGCG